MEWKEQWRNNMTKLEVFEEVLGELYARKELDSCRSQEILKRLHNEYDKWLKRYKEAE